MISDPSPGDSVFVIQITGKVTAAVITDLKPIEGLSCVSGKFSDADQEALIPLDACYTTESEALGYAIENAEFLLPASLEVYVSDMSTAREVAISSVYPG